MNYIHHNIMDYDSSQIYQACLMLFDIVIFTLSISIIATGCVVSTSNVKQYAEVLITGGIMLFVYAIHILSLHVLLFIYMRECSVKTLILITGVDMVYVFVLSAIIGWITYIWSSERL